MEFRLTYEGILLADTERDKEVRRARAEHKHIIRKAFHSQLKRWWDVSPYLRLRDSTPPGTHILGHPYAEYSIESLARNFNRFGYNFVPLVTKNLELLCSIEILFLRHGDPGNLTNRKGDIDNRLKTLFDALTMPQSFEQVVSFREPDEAEKPFFCLLEDDSVITRAAVKSDTLLQPVSRPPTENDSRVIITVKIRPARLSSENFGFA